MTDQNWMQDIETSVIVLGISYALSIICLIVRVA